MVEERVKDRSLVIMDVAYKDVLEVVTAAIFVFADEENESIIARPLALEHLEKMVVKFKATDFEMALIQASIEELYPGLCIFVSPMYV